MTQNTTLIRLHSLAPFDRGAKARWLLTEMGVKFEERWLDRANAPLQKIAESTGPAPARLEKWLRTMLDIKYKKVTEDPEMFATYLTLAQEACEAVKAHREDLMEQVAHMIADGVKQGAFQVADVKVTARALFEATTRYHHPAHADEWKDPARAARIDALLGLLLKGLEAPRKR